MSSERARALLAAATTATGVVLVTEPSWPRSARVVAPAGVVRLLGGRYVAQGLVEFANRGDLVLAAAVAVDALHLASMLPVAAGMPRYHQAALVSAGIAAAAALAGAALLRRPA